MKNCYMDGNFSSEYKALCLTAGNVCDYAVTLLYFTVFNHDLHIFI